MRPRIAIPEPHSNKPEYNENCLPHYIEAVQDAGGEAVTVPLGASAEEIAKIAATCDAVLLPGSPADVDPKKFNQTPRPETAVADGPREQTDTALLEHAYSTRKPVLGICYGLQSLNVWRGGSLVQHIGHDPVNHEPPKMDNKPIPVAHYVSVDPASRLAKVIEGTELLDGKLPVNSSHHQSADKPGAGLRVTASSPEDGVVEAVEGTDRDHWVVAVQWHPERVTDIDLTSRNLFDAFVEAAINSKSNHG
jgi:putative glutamine amidotransferase